MRLWLLAQRVPAWAVPVLVSSVLSGLVGSVRLPPLYLLGRLGDGVPLRAILPAVAATAMLSMLGTHMPRHRRGAVVPLARVELVPTVGVALVAGLIAEALTLAIGPEEAGLYTRNLIGLLGAGLLATRLLSITVAALVPVAWAIALLSFGNPEGGVLLSWVLGPELFAAGTVTALTLYAAGLLLGLARTAHR